MKQVTFTMSIIYDENDTRSGNALHALEHEMFNIEGIKEWEYEEHDNLEVEYEEEE